MDGAERVHLIGLVSDGGVHSSDRHLKALVELAGSWDVPDVVVHAFTDGRDTSPKGGAKYLADVESWGGARVGSVIGRYFAMDRDAYDRDETDEFITATTVGEEACIRPGDAVLGFNFRPDRMRQITRALAEDGFDEVDRGGAPVVERYATLAEYDEDWSYPVVFPPHRPDIT